MCLRIRRRAGVSAPLASTRSTRSTRKVRRAIPKRSFPVFYDPSGKRWYIVVGGTALLTAMVIALVVWVAPQALSPTWTPSLNQHSEYPTQLLATGDIEDIPLVGGENGHILNRLALVRRVDDRVWLTDPFSDAIFREATEYEVELIGDRPYVMEEFGRPADRQLMLTFDDGPHPEYTTQLLDLLSREGVPATFFNIGNNVVRYPDVFERIIREGHMLGNHTMTHIDFDAHGDARNREEVIGTDRVMRATAGYATRLFRIPEGDPHNNPRAVLHSQQLGFLHVNMDVDTVDWSYPPGHDIPVPQLDGAGHVVLMHDAGGDRSATIRMVEKLIHEAKTQGYTFSTMAPLLPAEYVPVRDMASTVADRATGVALAMLWVVPKTLLNWLFWFGVGSLTIMSLLYVVLALVNRYRQSRKKWSTLPDDQLPFVSVILPVFNEEPVVAKTLEALQRSDYPSDRMEVLAINDGSTDGTLAVLEEYARNWPQLRVISQENAGKSIASNNGIAHARGEVIVTLDGDTIFEPQTVRMFARHFADPDGGERVGAVAGHVKVGNRKNVLTAWQSLEYISGICVTRMAEGLVGAISIVPGACAAWRKEALLRAGGYSHDTMAEDADLTLMLQRFGYKIVQENDAVAWTEAPMTVKGLAKQRLRWTYGNLQALHKHRNMLLRPRYGALGMVALPYALLALVIPLLFLPLTVAAAVLNLIDGNWQSVALFAAFVAGIHLVISVIAVWMVRESPWHLLVVPIYRLIYEPLRAYLVYSSVLRALKGKLVGWYKPERTNSVVVAPSMSTAT